MRHEMHVGLETTGPAKDCFSPVSKQFGRCENSSAEAQTFGSGHTELMLFMHYSICPVINLLVGYSVQPCPGRTILFKTMGALLKLPLMLHVSLLLCIWLKPQDCQGLLLAKPSNLARHTHRSRKLSSSDVAQGNVAKQLSDRDTLAVALLFTELQKGSEDRTNFARLAFRLLATNLIPHTPCKM